MSDKKFEDNVCETDFLETQAEHVVWAGQPGKSALKAVSWPLISFLTALVKVHITFFQTLEIRLH